MSQRHLVIECVICRSPCLIPRLDTQGALTPEIAAYVCDSRRCFWHASWETLRTPSIAHAAKEACLSGCRPTEE